MAAKMLLSAITLRNFLSFRNASLKLGPLNVLIGPNACGKSNFIEAISLLRAAPVDLERVVLLGGGVRDWCWKGGKVASPIATLECRLNPGRALPPTLYTLEFSEHVEGFIVLRERLEEARSKSGAPEIFFERQGQKVTFRGAFFNGKRTGNISLVQSVLSGFKHPGDPTPITRLGKEFESIGIYHEFPTGPMAPARVGVAAAARGDFLDDGGDNLALVLQELDHLRRKDQVNEYLKRLAEGFDGVGVRLEGGRARLYVYEHGLLEPTPGIRLSDGTLKFLCLLAILLHPKPPSLICIEEPEVGLHPDALRLVVEALVDASQRTQLIVTTHSEALVDALSDKPETIVVVERDPEQGSQFQRLKRNRLEAWLKRYTLGELWRKGELGGTRW